MSNRKKVLVAGASSGIGAATAIRFAREGWDVCLNARRAPQLQDVHSSLAAGDHIVCAGDATQPTTAEFVRDAITSRWGILDVLVNSMGVFYVTDPIHDPLDRWRGLFDTLFNAAIILVRMSVPLMTRGGRIVLITSVNGLGAAAGCSSYAVAKAALNQYARSLAVDLAGQDILVNAIAPGYVDTPMSVDANGINELETDWFRRYYIEGPFLPLRRAARPEEIAGVAWFLAGPDASYVTGQVLTVDGGLMLTI